ncbi:MAG: hypothetical protein ABI599_18435 [Flavobacteriales bacterium]
MQRAAGIGFLLLFVFELVGMHPLQWALHAMARHDMLGRIRNEAFDVRYITRFSFALVNGDVSDPGFQWEEKGEFSYAGKMYDVVTSQKTADRVTLVCISDSRENRLTAASKTLDRSGAFARAMRQRALRFVTFGDERSFADGIIPRDLSGPGSTEGWPGKSFLLSAGFRPPFDSPPRG